MSGEMPDVYKRQVLAWKQVYASVDGHCLHNPTSYTFWLEEGGRVYTLAPGETLTL